MAPHFRFPNDQPAASLACIQPTVAQRYNRDLKIQVEFR